MLIKFAVTNFRGFSERIEWDLSKHNNYEFNPYAIKNGIIKNGIIYGPNGSGKTNFSLAIFDILYHLTQKILIADYFENYTFASKNKEFVNFEYTFKFDKQIIEYHYSKKDKGILVKECLKVNNSQIFKKDESSFEIDNNVFNLEKSSIENFKTNVNNVSVVNFLLSTFPLNDTDPLIKLKRFVDSMLWFCNREERAFIGLENGITKLEEYIISNNLLSDFAGFLEKIGHQKFELIADQFGKQILCKINNSVIPFSTIASTGTEALKLLYFWIKRISTDASFVFIDEFDAFYHYRLSFDICKVLFENLQCQIFMTSHNTYLMTNDLLRPDCNFIIHNNKIRPLSECTDKELREGHNIEKLFRNKMFD